MNRREQTGQAFLEYLFVLIIALTLIMFLVRGGSEFFVGAFGELGHYLTMNLTSGVCSQECFFSGYENGYQAN